MVLGELIEERAGRLKDKRFLRFKDRSYTYDEMNRFTNRCAHGFKKLGIVKNDKVSFMLPNSPEFIFLWWGSAKIGAVEVSINTSYKGERIPAPHSGPVRFEGTRDRRGMARTGEARSG